MLLGFAAALLSGAVASAHHSFAAFYFEDQSVSIEGEIDAFENRAPHAWVYVMAPDPDGRVRRYGAEWANPRRLQRDGITSETLKAGDRVAITGSPGRVASDYKVHLKRIRRLSDGWEWRGGQRGRRR